MSLNRKMARGGTLVIIVVGTLVLVIVGILAVLLTKILGGGQEVQNAVDNGALDAAKTALVRPGYTPTSASTTYEDELSFTGVAPTAAQIDGLYAHPATTTNTPPFALGDVNRVWGQALVVNVNLMAMAAEGSAVPTTVAPLPPGGNGVNVADAHTQFVTNAAKSINDHIARTLNPTNNAGALPTAMSNQFVSTANGNSLKMVSQQQNDQVTVSNGAKIGYQNVNQAANISVDTSGTGQFQYIVDDPTLLATITAALPAYTTQIGSTNYLKGYNNIALTASAGYNTENLYFIPLQPFSKPHMVSGMDFNNTSPSLAASTTPVNNSFFIKGNMREEKSNKLLDFAAIALAEPVDQQYPAAVPHGFIKIENLPGFHISNTPLLDTGANGGGGAVDPTQGLHAAEYANHQLLEARSSYGGPTNGGDNISQTMNDLYGVLETSSDTNVTDNGGDLFVDPSHLNDFPMASTPQVMTNPGSPAVPPGPGNPTGTPAVPPTYANDPTCGGALSNANGGPGHLPNGVQCTDVGTAAYPLAQTNPQIAQNGDNQLVSNDTSNDPAVVSWVTQWVGMENSDSQAYGSTNHPHIWSIDPQAISGPLNANINNPASTAFQQTAPTGWAWPNDNPWMYTGQQYIPANVSGETNVSRAASNADPILFTQATGATNNSVWAFLQDADPWNNTPHPQTEIQNRILQRILEIQPLKADGTAFNANGSDLQNLLTSGNPTSGSSMPMQLGQDAYIFLDDTQNPPQMTMQLCTHVTSGAPPELVAWPWLTNQITQLQTAANYQYINPAGQLAISDCLDGWGVLGKTMSYGQDRDITTDPGTNANDMYVENVQYDWGYSQPFTNQDSNGSPLPMNHIYSTNKYNFCPNTGYQGQLAVLYLENLIHHGGCGSTNGAPNANGVPGPAISSGASGIPEDCPCIVFPVGSPPANPAPTVNTPPGWNLGTGNVPAAEGTGGAVVPGGLPNCSHTGAC